MKIRESQDELALILIDRVVLVLRFRPCVCGDTQQPPKSNRPASLSLWPYQNYKEE